MNANRGRIRKLLTDYVAGTINQSNQNELLDYIARENNDLELDSLLKELLEEMETEEETIIDTETIYKRIITHPEFREKGVFIKQHNLLWFSSIAAAILLIIGMFLFYRESLEPEFLHGSVVSKYSAEDIQEDKKAILRLADGTEIDLDKAESGLLAKDGNMQITLKGTELHYEGDNVLALEGKDKTAMNTITTSRGRQFQVVLPDGSKMWLNASSSLIYPVRFNNDVRTVEISGEAYFEVEKAKDWPFIVKTSTQQVEVLGTHFNVSAYSDDKVSKTTLVEGRVHITTLADKNNYLDQSNREIKELSVILSPGQQAVTFKGNDKIKVEKVDPEEVVSWKQNLFVFNNEEISEVMKKIIRWYDIKVEYQDGMEGKRIGGTIPRFENIEKLMSALEATGLLRYKMEGGKVIIMK